MHRTVHPPARSVSTVRFWASDTSPHMHVPCRVTGSTIEDALSISPRDESTLFANRDKFDLIAIYDESSENMGDPNSPLSVLFKAIYEMAFRKFLKNMPMLLIGGLRAWKGEYGETETMSATVSPARPLHGMANGISPSLVNGTGVPGTPPTEPKSLGLALGHGHVRTPAESSTASTIVSPIPATPTTADITGIPIGRARSGTEPAVDPNAHRPWIPNAIRTPGETVPSSPR